MAPDALVAAGVVVAGGLILWTGWRWLDPAISLVISAVIVLGTWSLDGDSRSAIFVIMVRFACRFLLVLIALAVVGGPTLHLAQPPQFVPSAAVADVPCDMAMPMADAGHSTPMVPCKGMTPDCIKQMGCVADVALPTRMVGTDVVFAFSPVAYWSARSEMAGVVREPAYLPPRTT